MGNLKKAIKDNVLSDYSKYTLSQEKIGEVIEADADRNICTITYKNLEGILVVATDVPCKKLPLSGILKGFPKIGDFVEIQESGKDVRITGIIKKNTMAEVKQQNNDMHSGTNSFGGFLGM